MLAPWAWIMAHTSINGDSAWLLIAASRWLDGQGMVGHYFEANPPFNILFHVPAVFLARLSGLDIISTFYAFTFISIALAMAASARLLATFDFLDDGERKSLLAGFFIGATLLTSVSFAEREHFILLALFPFLLGQICLNWHIKTPRGLLPAVFMVGAAIILLKPHFGLIPVFFLLHRLYLTRKPLAVLHDWDFRALAVMTLGYIAISAALFPEYTATILPDVVHLYLGNTMPEIAIPEFLIYLSAFLIIACVDFYTSPLRGKARQFLFLLYASTLLCLIPYLVQMKGFSYHLFPALGIFLAALCLSIRSALGTKLGHRRHGATIFAILLLASGYILRPPAIDYPTHKDYKTLPFAALLDAHCPNNTTQNCRFLMFHDSIEQTHQTALYTGAEHGSRFPSFWFLPELILNRSGLDPALQSKLSEHYRHYAGEDMRAYEPDVLIISKNIYFSPEAPFDFLAYFSADPNFAEALQHYEFAEEARFNMQPYFKGTAYDTEYLVTYDVYRRTQPLSLP